MKVSSELLTAFEVFYSQLTDLCATPTKTKQKQMIRKQQKKN